MTRIENVLYTGKVHITSGGRDGSARSDDGRLDIALSSPAARGGTNPEQLLAAGWSACFIGAIGLAAGKQKIKLPEDLSVDAEVDTGTAGIEYLLQARLRTPPGIEREVAGAGGHRAPHLSYSKALHGNIHIETVLV